PDNALGFPSCRRRRIINYNNRIDRKAQGKPRVGSSDAQNPNNCAPRATSRRHINERASANADFSERESVQVTSSVCSLSRLRGRVGEGVNRMIYHVAWLPPVPPPPPGGGGGGGWCGGCVTRGC